MRVCVCMRVTLWVGVCLSVCVCLCASESECVFEYQRVGECRQYNSQLTDLTTHLLWQLAKDHRSVRSNQPLKRRPPPPPLGTLDADHAHVL